MCEDLLTKELWARSPYHVKVFYENDFYDILGISCGRVVLVKPVMSTVAATPLIKEVKLYLRPLSSITKEEEKELRTLTGAKVLYGHIVFPTTDSFGEDNFISEGCWTTVFDWLNEHHVDYRGLIEKGMAIKAPEDMYR